MTRNTGMTRARQGRYALVGADGTGRIYVRPHVLLPYGDLDEYAMPIPPERALKRNPRTRFSPRTGAVASVSAQGLPRHEQKSQGGMSMTAALCVAGILVFVLGIFTLVNTSRMTEKAKKVSAMRIEVETRTKENEALSLQVGKASDGAKICYTAARELGMVSAQGAEVVYLVAPETRTAAETAQASLPQVRAGIYATLFGFLDD